MRRALRSRLAAIVLVQAACAWPLAVAAQTPPGGPPAPVTPGQPGMSAPAPSAAPARPDPEAVLRQAIADMHQQIQVGRPQEAVRVAERAFERLQSEVGIDHPMTAVALFNVGAAQRRAGAEDDAAVTLQRALGMEAKLGSPTRASFRRTLKELAAAERARGQPDAAVALYDAAISRLRRDETGSLVEAELLDEQAVLIRHTADYAKAAATLQAALAIKEARLAPGHADLLPTLTQLGGIARLRGQFDEAEAHYRRAIDIASAGKPEPDANVAILVDNLGVLYQSAGRYADAETQHKRALPIFERVLGNEHLSTGTCVANLGAVAYQLGRYDDAEALLARALAIYAKTLPPEDVRFGVTLDNQAGVFRNQRRYESASKSYSQALAILRKAYSDTHPEVGTVLNNLALMQAETGQLAEAEASVRQSLAIAERTHGESHVDVAAVLNSLGFVHTRQGRLADARAAFARAATIVEREAGSEHPLLAHPLTELGFALLASGEAQSALPQFQRAALIELKRRSRGAAGPGGPRDQQRHDPFLGLIEATWQIEAGSVKLPAAKGTTSKSDDGRSAVHAEEALVQAQWVMQSQAGRSVAQLGARLGARTPALAALARERQDLSDEWSRLDRQLTGLLSRAATSRSPGDDAEMRKRLTDVDARVAVIDATLAKEHPGFSELAQPKPLTARELRSLIAPSEAMLVLLPSERQTYAWVVTRSEVRWQRLELGHADIARKVRTLRCGLDPAEWQVPARAEVCKTLAGRAPAGDVLPFDVATAADLYRSLVAPFSAAIEGKQLLVATYGALTSLPFNVLIADVPKDGSLEKAKWLGLRTATTTLPSIASLKSLRRDARASAAAKPYFGIGNPLLIGPNRDYSASWGAQSCLAAQLRKKSAPTVVAMDARSRGGIVRGGAIDVEQVRLLAPLPETRDELCGIAANAGAGDSDLALGSKASEKVVRDLSASGALRNYRTLHFATHGLIAGDVPGLTEAALVLTPPDAAAPDNDGLLTASEVATLRLDADLVILSACNTAAGDTLGAEALSGLSRAFFHAGARSLLVSHWPVQSMAAVKLTTRAMSEMRRTPGVGRAEAMRRSMAALVAEGSEPGNAHPQVWAPFVIVGDGGPTLQATPVAIGSVPPAAAAAGAAAAAAAGARLAPTTSSPQRPAREVLPWQKGKATPVTPAAATAAPSPSAPPASAVTKSVTEMPQPAKAAPTRPAPAVKTTAPAAQGSSAKAPANDKALPAKAGPGPVPGSSGPTVSVPARTKSSLAPSKAAAGPPPPMSPEQAAAAEAAAAVANPPPAPKAKRSLSDSVFRSGPGD
jgi:CHAT domain-containing protein/tetratricopeptide (TPR) repeat protein